MTFHVEHGRTVLRLGEGSPQSSPQHLLCITSLLYALRVLRCYGIPDQSLKDVFQATVLAKITYCLPAWSGLCTRLNSFLRRCVTLGYYSSKDPPTISFIADDVEDTLFKSILRNAQHVLQPYLEERPQLHYNLRNRPGINKTLIVKTVDLNDRDFLVRNLFKVSY